MTKHFHFSGVCGTAMAALAVLLKNRGHQVTGSDENTYPPMSDFLAENHIEVKTPYAQGNLNPHPDYIVLGNALSRGNVEVEYALKHHLHYLSMAELLKNEFIRGNRSVVITGTHGKTSTTSLASHVLHACGKDTGFMVGGIVENFGTSSQDVKKGGYFVIEGDEYDTSLFDKRSKFFHYLPDVLIINNIEFDHADIFNDIDEIKQSFSRMLRQIPQDGLIIVNGDDANSLEVAKTGFTPYVTFGQNAACDVIISNAQPIPGKLGMRFTMTWRKTPYDFEIPLLGEFNVYNATAVTIMALNEGVSPADIQTAFSSFKNVRRRLQQVSGQDRIRVFDDFAHHPTAIAETVRAVRQAWPEAKLHTIYEARSNTSVRSVHQKRMADAFADADSVIFYKLHREEKLSSDDKLDLGRVVSELTEQGKQAEIIPELDQIVAQTVNRAKDGDIILVMSQGAFGGIQHRIAAALDQR